ncbi:hypothetical protein Dimus_003531 [Dionaea muscipula]
MGSKGRIPPPPPYMRGPHPSLGMALTEPFGGPAIRPPQGSFPVFDMLPPPEIVEQKLAAQHIEMDSLATENQRLAATHGTLRQQLAAAQKDLNILEARLWRESSLFMWEVVALAEPLVSPSSLFPFEQQRSAAVTTALRCSERVVGDKVCESTTNERLRGGECGVRS